MRQTDKPENAQHYFASKKKPEHNYWPENVELKIDAEVTGLHYSMCMFIIQTQHYKTTYVYHNSFLAQNLEGVLPNSKIGNKSIKLV